MISDIISSLHHHFIRLRYAFTRGKASSIGFKSGLEVNWQEHNQVTSTVYNPLNMVNTTVVHHHYAVGISATDGALVW